MNLKVALLVIFGAAVIAGLFVYPKITEPFGFSFPNRPFRFGLDIRGGSHLVYQADVSAIAPDEQDDALRGLRDVIERRVNAFGVSEPVITVNTDTNRLIAELAGVLNTEEAIALIGSTPFLEFREPVSADELPTATATPAELFRQTELTGRFLERASLVFDPQTSAPLVGIEFNERGSELFAEITARNIGQPLAIFLDGQILSAPIVEQEITGGIAQITGSFTVPEARELAQNLNAGALPVPITLISQQTVGPILGQASLNASLLAGIIGFGLVALYMIFYYRFAGVIAVLSLSLYALGMLAIFKLIPVTLTLAGIVGFLLTIGIAVDASILVFERMKEELREGRPYGTAVEQGFMHAKSAIRDAYISTLITAGVLYWFGTSLIRGFALTLAIGLIFAYIITFAVTRTFLRATGRVKISNMPALWRR